MSAIQDNVELEALFKHNSNNVEIATYNQVNWNYVLDNNSSDTIIRFNNDQLLSSVCSLSDSYFEIPIQVTTSYNNKSQVEAWACKTCAVDLIESLHVQISSGDTIVQETSTLPFINNFRRRLKFNELGLKERAVDYQYSPDSFPNLSLVSNASADQPLKADGTGQNFASKYTVADINSSPLQSINVNQIGVGAPVSIVYDNSIANSSDTIGNLRNGQQIFFSTGANAGTMAKGLAFDQIYYVRNINTSTSQFNVSLSPTGPLLPTTVAADTGTSFAKAIYINVVTAYANPKFNSGFADRLRYRIENSSQADAGGNYTVTFTIPLNELHDIFKQWVFPIVNFGLRLSLTLARPINGSANYNFAMREGNSSMTALPTMKFTAAQAKWWIKQIQLEPKQLELMKNNILSGVKKQLTFTETQVFKVATNENYQTQVTHVISNSISHVKRIIFFALPYLAATSDNITINPTIRFKTCELKINNQPFRTYAISSTDLRGQFRGLREQTHGSGYSDTESSLISWDNYQKGFIYYYVFDFERPGLREDWRSPVAINIDTDKDIYGQFCDYYVMVEREATCDMFIDTNTARIHKFYA